MNIEEFDHPFSGRVDGGISDGESLILGALAISCRNTGTHALEIGTFEGDTTTLIARALPDHHIITVDLPDGASPSLPTEPEESKYIGRTPAFPPDVEGMIDFVKEDSALVRLADWHKLGFSFIDGSHSYEYTLNDFRLAWRYSVIGALIVFHDYAADCWPGVTRAVNELSEEFHSRSIWTRYKNSSLVICQKDFCGVS